MDVCTGLLHQPEKDALEGDGIHPVGLGSHHGFALDEHGGGAEQTGLVQLVDLVLGNGGGARVEQTGLQFAGVEAHLSELALHPDLILQVGDGRRKQHRIQVPELYRVLLVSAIGDLRQVAGFILSRVMRKGEIGLVALHQLHHLRVCLARVLALVAADEHHWIGCFRIEDHEGRKVHPLDGKTAGWLLGGVAVGGKGGDGVVLAFGVEHAKARVVQPVA